MSPQQVNLALRFLVYGQSLARLLRRSGVLKLLFLLLLRQQLDCLFIAFGGFLSGGGRSFTGFLQG